MTYILRYGTVLGGGGEEEMSILKWNRRSMSCSVCHRTHSDTCCLWILLPAEPPSAFDSIIRLYWSALHLHSQRLSLFESSSFIFSTKLLFDMYLKSVAAFSSGLWQHRWLKPLRHFGAMLFLQVFPQRKHCTCRICFVLKKICFQIHCWQLLLQFCLPRCWAWLRLRCYEKIK